MPFVIPNVSARTETGKVELFDIDVDPGDEPLEAYIAWLEQELKVAKTAWEAASGLVWSDHHKTK